MDESELIRMECGEETFNEDHKDGCPNCFEEWDGISCDECGFDAFCYNPMWD